MERSYKPTDAGAERYMTFAPPPPPAGQVELAEAAELAMPFEIGLPAAAGERLCAGEPDRAYLAVKRATDVAASALLLIMLAPVMALIALAIRFDSPGPALFRQARVAENRRRSNRQARGGVERRVRDAFAPQFLMHKFRTMYVDSPAYAPSPTNGDDPRVTRVGRLLRRTCLDEVPQLVNVLRGEMSLVGPRPEMPFIVSRYDATQRRRLDVKPGITGLWQLYGPRDRAIHESIEFDFDYIERRSWALDLRILLRTLRFAFRQENH